MIRYGYICESCGADYETNKQPAPPETIQVADGIIGVCPPCARAIRQQQAQQIKQARKKHMPTPDELRAAADRMEQIHRNKSAETDPGEEDYDEYLDEEEPAPAPAPRARRPIRREVRETRTARAPMAHRRSRMADAMERLETALDAYEKAEDELLEAQEEYEQIKDEVEARQERIASRFRKEPPSNERRESTITGRRRTG